MPDDKANGGLKLPEWIWRVLALLVIPLIGWGVKLEVHNAVMVTEITRLKEDVKEAQSIQAGVIANTNSLGRMEEKINGINAGILEIKDVLRRSNP